MSSYDELKAILRELLFNRFYPKPQYIRGLLGDGQGNVIVPDRPDYNYVRFNRSSSETFEVFNKEVSQPVDGWPILIGEFPWQPGLIQIVGTDWAAYSQTGWGDSVASIQAHAPTHEWPTFAPGSDPVNIYLRAHTALRTQVVGSGSNSVYVTPYEYDFTGTSSQWPGVPSIDFSSKPPTGSMLYMGVYLNPATNALGVVSGSTTVFTDAIEPAIPRWPLGVYPSGYVRLYGGQAGITERDIRDARRLWNNTLTYTGTSASGGAPSGPAGGDLTGTYPDPRVVSLNTIPILGVPTVNQFLMFTGSAWRPASFSGGGTAASQATVDAGTNNTEFVSPLTLRGTPTGLLKVKNTSGATANANEVGYIDGAGEYKTTTTANLDAAWCVVVTGGANNADIYVTTRGRVTIEYAGSAPSAGNYLVTSTTAGSAAAQATMRPEIFAICTAAGSGGLVEALLLTGRIFKPATDTHYIYGISAASDSDFVATIATYDGVQTLTYTAPSSGSEDAIAYWTALDLAFNAKLVLHNTTRSNSARISSVTVASNTIVLLAADASPAGWAVGDTITVRSQTNTQNWSGGAYYFDWDMSGFTNKPALATAILIHASISDSSATAAALSSFHPFEAFSSSKNFQLWSQAGAANVRFLAPIFVPLINHKFTFGWDATGSATAIVFGQLAGWIVAVP